MPRLMCKAQQISGPALPIHRNRRCRAIACINRMRFGVWAVLKRFEPDLLKIVYNRTHLSKRSHQAWTDVARIAFVKRRQALTGIIRQGLARILEWVIHNQTRLICGENIQ